MNQLTEWLQRYQAGEPFPKIAVGSRHCEDCSFAVRCDRTASPQENRATSQNENRKASLRENPVISPDEAPLAQPNLILPLPDLADIQEIPI